MNTSNSFYGFQTTANTYEAPSREEVIHMALRVPIRNTVGFAGQGGGPFGDPFESARTMARIEIRPHQYVDQYMAYFFRESWDEVCGGRAVPLWKLRQNFSTIRLDQIREAAERMLYDRIGTPNTVIVSQRTYNALLSELHGATQFGRSPENPEIKRRVEISKAVDAMQFGDGMSV